MRMTLNRAAIVPAVRRILGLSVLILALTGLLVFLAAVTAGLNLQSAIANAQPHVAGDGRPSRSISVEMAHVVTGLIADIRLRPSVNAVDTFAAAFHWRKTPSETNALLNAKVGYAGKVAGQMVLLGGDGTNDIFAVSARDGFRADEAVAELRHVYRLKKLDSEESDGQRADSYSLIDGRTEVGLLTLTYGITEAIRGGGTIAFVATERARREIAAHHEPQ